MKSGLEFLPVRGRLAAALVELSPSVAAFYSARHLALDVRGHAAADHRFTDLVGDENCGAAANEEKNKQFGFKHRGVSIS